MLNCYLPQTKRDFVLLATRSEVVSVILSYGNKFTIPLKLSENQIRKNYYGLSVYN